MDYYNLDKKEVLSKLNSSLRGLKQEEAEQRLKKYGLNYIEKVKRLSGLKIFLSQFNDIIIYILIFAVLVSLFLGHFIDAIVIGAILFLNAVLGFVQEFKAEKSISLLRKLSSPKAKVLRDNKPQVIDSKNLVPGDIVLLEVGDKISADGRLLESIDFQIDESILTGESTPVAKNIKAIKHEKPLAERINMVFSGTIVTAGRAKFAVTTTGMEGEIGKVAHLVQVIDGAKTPLEKRLKRLGFILGGVVVIIAVLILLLGLFEKIEFYTALLTAISLAVAVIPEGLPAVVTICLALGVQRMLKQKALVRKLKAVETLGDCNLICADKTGTITKNEMTVKQIFVNDKLINVTGAGYDIHGDFIYNDKKIDSENFKVLLEGAANCNNSSLPNFGDPTELALLVMAKKGNVNKFDERIHEELFSSKKKYMMTTHVTGKGEVTYVKGAPEKVLELSDYYYMNGKEIELSKRYREKILDENSSMAGKALRVLGIGYIKNKKRVFAGLCGMIDPPRRGVKESIKLCNDAGIRVIMITGDHKTTAEAIAKQVGIKGKIMEGKELDKISNLQLKKLVSEIGIYARVSPEHKVRILKALQEKGNTVAMTGDGVNDAPALKRADVGVAMSIKGTDVARTASDMVLLDDNFSTIVSAVEEGRVIYDNIKKFVKFLLTSNFVEFLVIFLTMLFGFSLPLLPLQILWINLISDGLPALALSVDNPEKGIMMRKPRERRESILKGMLPYLLGAGILGTAAGLIGYFDYLGDINKARTMVMTIIIMFEMFWVFSCRSEKYTVFELKNNKWLYLAVIFSICLHLGMMYSPLGVFFKVVGLNFTDWLKVIGLSCVGFVVFESKKLIWR